MSGALLDSRSWTVLRATSTTQFFEGIVAASAEEAIQKYLDGDGELNPERTTTTAWSLDAEPRHG